MGRLRIFTGPGDEGPYTTWKSRLVWRFMRGTTPLRDYHHKLFFGEKDGMVTLVITTPSGEIVAQCRVINPDLLLTLIEHVQTANAQAKLVNRE